ncbi:MAG: hypothetical protein A3G33_08280 [Omnitrophica bacterium RIFCSPLOWO2_12_FULL_44_17]|uniref:TraG P-loop domain-containing protein n=1 Tax=Candidatus Danuiimicrobium aquiferis TaxID=1801832 RepID=A0A1G1KW95_9BACT|nr:MAG: hypothetical protein A3B72_03495 [Omnitrophica bacterium RIFCSPHIGHO2_02_FULL_45_28]OGW90521.1 MAG: hypothetical protein A3E74_03020 [Omnitrophica bacterium RIFCSPHIGHO2_12_FULL_44_12]OGW97161.1 MAG: hypothetical protein A3G33_08280 [Omnitrophica bacterium RIFCSPLOWO2_12_FULL_44_17]
MKTNLLIKTRDLIQREKSPSFLKELDLYSVEEGVLIGVSGSMGRAFQFVGRDLLLKSETEIDDFERRMHKYLNALPERATLHFVVRSATGDDSSLHEYASSIQVQSPLTQTFLHAKLNEYLKHPFTKRDVFLFVVIHPEWRKARSSFLPDISIAFGKKARRLSEIEFNASKETLFTISSEIEESFRDLGFRIRPLEDAEIIRYLYELLNPSYSEEIVPFEERYFETNEFDPASLRSKLALHPPLLDREYFYLDHFFHRAVNLTRLPESTNLKSMKEFEQVLGKDYFLTLTLEVPDQDQEKAQIKRQGNFAKAKNFFSRTKDHEALARAGETEELLTEIASSSDKLFYVSMSVMVRGRSKEETSLVSREELRAFRRLGDAQGLEDHMNHDRLFLSFLPLQGDENPLAFIVRSEVLVHLLPLQSSWPGTDRIGLLLKTYRDEPLRLDLFDSKLPAKHSVMLGATGSGKSFFTNHLLLHFLMESLDHEVIVIDLGGSYRKLAGVLEGAYLEVECTEKFALNPFPVKEVLFPGESADATFIQFLKELLEQMIAPKHEWSSSEKMILERVISETYRNLGRDEAPLLGDVEKRLRNYKLGDEEDQRKAYQFAKELTLFTEGEYGKILNRRGVFDFDARFTVFDLRKISQYPELQEILLLIIPFALKRKFENLNLKKMLVLDECWKLLKETQGTDLVETFYRTARKMNAAVLSISQNPEDFLDAAISGVMINNSPVKYILRLKKSHEKLALFGLNENEIKAAGELEVKPGRYSEIFIKFDDQSVIAKLEPSALEYWAATTDALDLAEEAKLKRNHPEYTDLQVLETLAKQFPNGVQKTGDAQHV